MATTLKTGRWTWMPTFEPMVKVGKVLLDHDSVQYVQVNNVYVYPQPVFKNAKERMAYNRWYTTSRRCCR